MTTNKLRQMYTVASVTFLSGILLTSTIMMMIPSAEAYDPQPQIWFGSKNTKDLGKFLKYEKYDGYGWHTKVNVMIYAPGWNTDSGKYDTIGTSEDEPIGMIVRNNTEGESGAVRSLSPCGFTETGPDTGLFYGRVKLSGTDLDVNGDGKEEKKFGGSACSNIAIGSSKHPHREAAKLETTQAGALTVWWKYNDSFNGDEVVSRTAYYSMSEAKIEFSQEYYEHDDRILIKVTDKDLKGTPKDKATVKTRVYSDSDSAGVTIEFDKKLNPAILYLTTENESNGRDLYAQPGDTIYAEYDDYLMPPFDADGNTYSIGNCHSSTQCDPSDHKTILAIAKILR